MIFCLIIFSTELLAQQILVKPYIQPGNYPNLSKEGKVIIWQTDSIPAPFIVEYFDVSEPTKILTAKPTYDILKFGNGKSILYRAELKRLKPDKSYSYKVKKDNELIYENKFSSRSKNENTRFIVLGDCGRGTTDQIRIAYQMEKQKPEYVVIVGDVVYVRGLESEYRANFFPFYNKYSNDSGVDLMGSIPFYSIIGNHDVAGHDLTKYPDGLAFYYYNDLPLNAPKAQYTIEVEGDKKVVSEFIKNTRPRFPNISNYSFDYGNVHFACLDANPYVNPLESGIVQWLKSDLSTSKSRWKIVAYHHPGFNSSNAHYNDQYMRLLTPILEELKVDLVLTGHVHNYQRSKPFTFKPELDVAGTHYVVSKEGRVNGSFVMDEQFDGVTNTKPNGIIYITTGAGGAPLYDQNFTDNPELWKHDPPENWAPFTVKMISDKHSFTLFETHSDKLEMKQLDSQGKVLDQITIQK